MYLPRDLISLLYTHLLKTRHAQSPPVLLLVSLEPDALCACRILTNLLKRDYIPHNIVPVCGYGDLQKAGEQHVQPMRTQNGGSGGTVICLGTGGLVDLGDILGLESGEDDQTGFDAQDPTGGVQVWVVDARRPWNLGNVFGGTGAVQSREQSAGRPRTKDIEFGKIRHGFKPGRGGVIVFDDADISDELEKEQEAYFKLEELPPVDDDGRESDDSESESGGEDEPRAGQKRKAWANDEDEEDYDERPRQRRRSNSQESIPVTPTRTSALSSSIIPNSQISPSPSATPPSAQPRPGDRPLSARRARRRLLRLKRSSEAVLQNYYSRGSTYAEPISSILYSLASALGREDNDLLWHSIVGVTSVEQYGRSSSHSSSHPHSIFPPSPDGSPGAQHASYEAVLCVLRDEVRRLNPPEAADRTSSTSPFGNFPGSTNATSEARLASTLGMIPTYARSPNDTSIRLSPEPRLLLIRHWSLYESMLHSPYLAARLHLWNDSGKRRLHKLLAKMGISLNVARQGYTHMDVEAKRNLRGKLLKYAPLYGLEGLVPPEEGSGSSGPWGKREGWGFVRSWGWKACLSAGDVGTVVGAVLEVGKAGGANGHNDNGILIRNGDVVEGQLVDVEGKLEGEEYVERFWAAYDALENVTSLVGSLPLTMALHRAILRTGTSLIAKRQIRHLRAFRMAVVKDGPDVPLFTHPGALTKLALWLSEAIQEQEKDAGKGGKGPTPLVLAGLNEKRGVYVVVGTGGGGGVVDLEARRERKARMLARKARTAAKAKEKTKQRQEKAAEREARRRGREADGEDGEEEVETESEAESSSSDEDEDDGGARPVGSGRGNRFSTAFQEVIDETGATTRIDSFETCVIEVRKDDLAGFLEALSMKAVA